MIAKGLVLWGVEPNDAVTQMAFRFANRMEAHHGPLERCNVVIRATPTTDARNPRYQVWVRVESARLGTIVSAEPVVAGRRLTHTVYSALRRADSIVAWKMLRERKPVAT